MRSPYVQLGMRIQDVVDGLERKVWRVVRLFLCVLTLGLFAVQFKWSPLIFNLAGCLAFGLSSLAAGLFIARRILKDALEEEVVAHAKPVPGL
jgi:hypothetical protein